MNLLVHVIKYPRKQYRKSTHVENYQKHKLDRFAELHAANLPNKKQ